MSSTRISLLYSMLSLSVAFFGLYLSKSGISTVDKNSMMNFFRGNNVRVGSHTPTLLAYDTNEIIHTIPTQGQNETIIFTEACPCDAQAVQYWASTAVKRGDKIFVVVPESIQKVSMLHYFVPGSSGFLAMRVEDYSRLDITKDLPFAIHVNPRGFITDISSS